MPWITISRKWIFFVLVMEIQYCSREFVFIGFMDIDILIDSGDRLHRLGMIQIFIDMTTPALTLGKVGVSFNKVGEGNSKAGGNTV